MSSEVTRGRPVLAEVCLDTRPILWRRLGKSRTTGKAILFLMTQFQLRSESDVLTQYKQKRSLGFYCMAIAALWESGCLMPLSWLEWGGGESGGCFRLSGVFSGSLCLKEYSQEPRIYSTRVLERASPDIWNIPRNFSAQILKTGHKTLNVMTSLTLARCNYSPLVSFWSEISPWASLRYAATCTGSWETSLFPVRALMQSLHIIHTAHTVFQFISGLSLPVPSCRYLWLHGAARVRFELTGLPTVLFIRFQASSPDSVLILTSRSNWLPFLSLFPKVSSCYE